MSRIDDLLATHCPEGVEFKELGDIARLVRGNGMPKVMLTDEGVGAIHYGQIYTRYGAWTTSTYSFVTPEDAEKLAKAEPGDLIITNTSENIEDVGKAVAWLGESAIVTGGHATVIKHDLEPKYLSYWFQSPSFVTQKRALATGTKVIDVSARQLMKVRVPVPPLEVQREIVRILDQFSQLEAELEAELEARRRQYDYHRERLLSSDEPSWAPLAELLSEPLANGRSVPDGDGYPVLRLTALRGPVVDTTQHKLGSWTAAQGSRFRIEAGDLLVVRGNGSKAIIGRGVMVEETAEIAFPDTMIRVRPDLSKISQRYLFHAWECRSTRSQLERSAKLTAGVWKVSQDDVEKIRLPLVDPPEQARIVQALDRFDALVNDLSVGLPAELAARRKQYEHYRDRLLTFTEAP